MHGEPVEFELVTNDGSVAQPVVIRSAGSNTERPLAANERLIIHDMRGWTQSGGTFLRVFTNESGTGDDEVNEAIWYTSTAAREFASHLGRSGALGIAPYAKTDNAGILRLTGEGMVVVG